MTNESICKGLPASEGVVTGIAVHIDENATTFNQINENSILVTQMTNIKFVPAMRKAAGIITSLGGRLCHAAMISREIETPCVVGIGPELFTTVKNGDEITIDGKNGLVFMGKRDV